MHHLVHIEVKWRIRSGGTNSIVSRIVSIDSRRLCLSEFRLVSIDIVAIFRHSNIALLWEKRPGNQLPRSRKPRANKLQFIDHIPLRRKLILVGHGGLPSE